MPAYSQDTIALGIIAEGRRSRTDGSDYLRHPVMTERGIVIALATGIVETNLTMYANNSDPESLKYPHDAISADANSSGVFQQRDPWWGTAADRMDVARSAAMFYNHLYKLDYNNTANSPGSYAQGVQRSAYPDRYDQHIDEAQAIYNRLQTQATVNAPVLVSAVAPVAVAPSYQEIPMFGNGYSSRSRKPINFFIHTQEGDGTAQSLAQFCNGSNNVSYHYTLRDGVLCDVVDTDYYSWSVLNANVFSINLCFAGSFAGWNRDQWLAREKDIAIAAWIAVQDAHKYGFSTEVITPPYHQAPGISDHKYVTQCLGIGTHRDVGDQFPWDVFKKYVAQYTTPAAAAQQVGSTVGQSQAQQQSAAQGGESMANVPQDQWNRVYAELTKRFNSRSPFRFLGQGEVDTFAGMTLNIDGSVHVLLIKALAEMGYLDALTVLSQVANADLTKYPDRAGDAKLARAVLNDIAATRPQVIQDYLKQKGGK